MISIFHWFVDFVLHLDHHLNELAVQLGGWLYGILFLIVFCETGLVVTPFLPGDSLLFAVGAMTAIEGSVLNFSTVFVLLFLASVLGDALNYSIGYRLGPKVFQSETSWLLNKEHLARTRKFYERYGGRTIVFARFIPVVRTFAPFVAGVGQMRYRDFAVYNIFGGLLWSGGFLTLGRLFGNLKVVKHNFSLVVIGIILLSLVPLLVEYLKSRRTKSVSS